MSKFAKGVKFTMGGKEYQVLAEGSEDPASCLVYASLDDEAGHDPQSIRMWKAEAKLARGDILINGFAENPSGNDSFYPPITDPLEQIAELKRRIQAIEERRLTLLKIDDPLGQILLQDNMVRPNKPFDIWAYTVSSNPGQRKRPIQYIKIRGLVLGLTAESGQTEHFLFNIGDQLPPCCRISGDTLSTDGEIKINLSGDLKTIHGARTSLLSREAGGKIELSIGIRLTCKFASGMTVIGANILKAAYIREVKAPVLKIGKLAFPEIGEHAAIIEGVSIDIYTEGK